MLSSPPCGAGAYLGAHQGSLEGRQGVRGEAGQPERRAAALKTINDIRASGIVSARGIARERTTRKMPTTTGSPIWAAAQVLRLLKVG